MAERPFHHETDLDHARRVALRSVDEAIAVYQALLPVRVFDRARLIHLKQALINLSDDLETFLLLGEASDDEPYADDGVSMLGVRDEDTPRDDDIVPVPLPDTPAVRRQRMTVVRRRQTDVSDS